MAATGLRRRQATVYLVPIPKLCYETDAPFWIVYYCMEPVGCVVVVGSVAAGAFELRLEEPGVCAAPLNEFGVGALLDNPSVF